VPASAPPPRISLPAASELRERAANLGRDLQLEGDPRERFFRAQRAALTSRLLPTFALVAIACGATAVWSGFEEGEAWRSVAMLQGATAVLLGALSIGVVVARRSYVSLVSLELAGGLVLAIGCAYAAAWTGGTRGPYALALPFALSVVLLAAPTYAWVALTLLAAGALATLAASGVQPATLTVLTVVAAGTAAFARARRRRTLSAFRKVERLSAALSRVKELQEQLVVVEKLEAMRVLVGGMAHELNNGLAVAVASVDHARSEVAEGSGPARASLDRARTGLGRIRATLDRLRRFALSGEEELGAADVGAMLDFALESAIGRARSGIAIDRDYASDVGVVHCHVAALAEALFQISRNAIESMSKGGTVRATLRGTDDQVVVTVSDEGKGIPPERLARVFDPFFTRDGDTLTGGRLLSRSPGKSGLGLSAVYGLVASLGGRVEIQSELGRGTTVRLLLPRASEGQPTT
jgi:signal transduction histidine kinase